MQHLASEEIESLKGLIKSGQLANLQLAEQIWGKNSFNKFIEEEYGELLCLINKAECNAESVSELLTLQEIKIDYRFRAKSLPKTISNLPNLKVLSALNTPIEFLPETIGDLKSMEHLSFWNSRLTVLPEPLFYLPNLKVLTLWDSKIASLPELIVNLVNLEKLYLGGNKRISLPESLATLKKLEKVFFSHNGFTEEEQEQIKIKLPQAIFL